MLSTTEVIQKLGIKSSGLYYLLRNRPELKPQERLGAYMAWSEEEIERLCAALEERRLRREARRAENGEE